MTCTLTSRDQVRDLVLAVIDIVGATEASNFKEDLGLDKTSVRGKYRSVKNRVEDAGCDMSPLGPGDFEKLHDKTVGDMVTLVWHAVKKNSENGS